MERRRLLRLLDAVAAAVVVAILAGWLLKTPLRAGGWARRDLNDYTLNLRHSREVAETHAYPFGFTYPPPSVLFRLALGALGFEIGGGLWIALAGAGLLVSLLLVWWMLGGLDRPGIGLLALSALLLVKYPFEFEYKYLNSNALFLALTLAAVALADLAPRVAGLLLSLSIALKLYSAVFLPWLFLVGRRRALGWALAGCVLWFIALPIAVWGVAAAREVNQSWFQRVLETGTRDFPERFTPYAYLVSLHATMSIVAERLALPNALDGALLATRLLQAAWAAAVVCVLARYRPGPGPRGLLFDACLLLLLPLPLSGQLQPHHAVVLLPAAFLLMGAATEPTQGRRRGLFPVVLGASFALMEWGPAPPWRGAALHAVFVLYVAGLAAVRRPSSAAAR